MKESKSGEVEKLKARIRRLESDLKDVESRNKKLLSEIKTLEAYRKVTTEHIGNKLDGIPVERVVKQVKNEQRAKKRAKESVVKSACPVCFATVKVIGFRAGQIHVCSNPKCKFRETKK